VQWLRVGQVLDLSESHRVEDSRIGQVKDLTYVMRGRVENVFMA